MAADKAARVYCARDCIYHPAMPASNNARVICFATQLSKMRLSIRGEKWIASLRAAETEGEKKKLVSRASVYIRVPHESRPPYKVADTTVGT